MKSGFKTEKQYLRAKKRVDDIKGFYIHLFFYGIIIPVIIFINLNFTPEFHWFWFSVLGWGFGLLMHWFGIFGLAFLGFNKDWETKKIKEYMNQY